MKKKLSLNDLKVKSFITNLEDNKNQTNEIKGGRHTESFCYVTNQMDGSDPAHGCFK